jgi:tetratricopeptide (TPR) repeat protein
MNPNSQQNQTPDRVPLGFISGNATEAEHEAFANQMADKIVTEHQRDKAVDVMKQGLKLLTDHRNKEALTYFRRGLKVFKRLVADGHAEYTCDVAESHYEIGEAFFRAGNHEKCVASNDTAIRLWRGLVGSGHNEHEIQIAYALSTNADALLFLNRFDEALTVVEESIHHFRQACDADPNPHWNRDLAGVINLRGRILGRLGRVREAAESCREAAELRDGVDRNSAQE